MVRGFFSPTWKDLGVLATYGRWLGVNWVRAEWLTIYHAIFSITIPIFLAELTFPRTRSRIWLSTKLRVFFYGLLVLVIVLGFFAFPYDAPVLGLAGCIGAVVFLGWLPSVSRTSLQYNVTSESLGEFWSHSGSQHPSSSSFSSRVL